MRQNLQAVDYPQVPPSFGAPSRFPFTSGAALGNPQAQWVHTAVQDPTNIAGQWSSAYSFESHVLTILRNRFPQFTPQSKLNSLKQQTFAAEGRDARISASLAALNRPPVFPASTDWKRAAESPEYDEED